MFKHRKLIKRLFLAVLFIHIFIVLSFWWATSRFYITSGSLGLTFIALGRLFGLLGVTFALQQFILIGRLPILEKAFGQDSMSKTHQLTGYLTFFTIISHPFLIIYGNAITNRQGFISQYLFFFKYYEDIWQASIAIICLIAIVGSSIWIVRSRLKYQWWYLVHLLTYALIVFAFGHQNELGSSINGSSFSKLYWLTMYTVILGVFGFYRFLRPLWLYINHDFKVVKTEAESPNVTSIYIKGRNMEAYKWKPGQFAIFIGI